MSDYRVIKVKMGKVILNQTIVGDDLGNIAELVMVNGYCIVDYATDVTTFIVDMGASEFTGTEKTVKLFKKLKLKEFIG